MTDWDRMADSRARTAYAAAAWLFLGCVLIQAFLVGLDIFGTTEGSIHRDFAYLYGWLAPVMVLLAGVGRLSARTRALGVLLLVLFAVQTFLPILRETFPLLAALHTVNALVIFGLAVVLARRAGAPGPLGERASSWSRRLGFRRGRP